MANFHGHATRRRVIGLGAAAGVALAVPGFLRAAPMMAELKLYGPPAGPSITLAHAVARGALAGIAATVSFAAWKDPDELRSGLVSGTMGAVILPTQAAANLYNRGLGLRLVNAMTDGLTYVVSPDPALATVASLQGRKLALPFRNDTPDILLRRLLHEAGLAPDAVEVVPAANPIEAVQLLLSGRAEAAVLPEPAGTMAAMRAAQEGRAMHRVIDMQAEWGKITGLGRSIPQAGLGVTQAFHEQNPEAAAALQAAIAGILPDVLAQPEAAAASAADALGMPAPVLAKSIPHCALIATPASVARPALEAMYRAVAETDPAIIGGKLPDDGFYLL
jgi:NitT/TauT family transport system substrate-binding protein